MILDPAKMMVIINHCNLILEWFIIFKTDKTATFKDIQCLKVIVDIQMYTCVWLVGWLCTLRDLLMS